MGTIQLFGKTVDYKPYTDEMYMERLGARLKADMTFVRVFQKNLTSSFIDHLRKIVDPTFQHEQNFIISVSGGTGCQPKGSKVLMADGSWKHIQNIRVGDRIITFDKSLGSKVGTILRTTMWLSPENYSLYQTNRHQKLLYSCSHNHIIPYFRRKGFRIKGKNSRDISWRIEETTAKEFYNLSHKNLTHSTMGITCPAIKEFGQKENCKIEPYTLGIYISDGSYRHGANALSGKKYYYLCITKMPGACTDYFCKEYPPTRISPKRGSPAKTFAWKLDSEFANLLNEYGYNGVKSGKKFIPKEALYSDLEYRKKLLAGLIDGDGTFEKGYYSFTSKSRILVEQIEFLVHSVGGRVNQIKRRWGKIASYGFKDFYWVITFFIHEHQGIPILTRKKTTKSFYLGANRQSVSLKKREGRELVYGFTVDGETGFYITDNWMLTHNTGKSIVVISLAKLLVPQRFTYKNICFYDAKILELAKDVPRDSIIIRDENPSKAVYGAGSQRIEMDIMVLAETVRKYGLSLILVEPSEKQMDIVKWYLETVDIDYENRITRMAVKDPYTKQYLGAIYIPVLPSDDPDWVEYNKVKDQFIKDVRAGRMSGAKTDYASLAKKIAKDIDTAVFSKKGDRLVYIQSVHPTFTNQEIKIIHTFVEIILQGGEDALPHAETSE